MKSLHAHWLVLGGLILLAAWLRLPHLGAVNLYNDEYYQFETAVGWLNGGELARYDFYTDTLGEVYNRAVPFIAQVIMSLKIFGVSEAAARLPAALWGIALVPLVALAVYHITKHRYVAYSIGAVLALDDFMIGLSRYVRMYSMLIICLFVVGVAVYQWGEAKSARVRWAWVVAGVIALLLSLSVFKELTLAMVGAIGVYVLLRWFMYLFKRRPQDQRWFILGCIGVGVVLVAVILQTAGYNVYPVDAIIVRSEPHWTYVQLLYENWRFAGVAGIFALIGVGSQCFGQNRNWRSFTLYSASLSAVVILYFVFFSHRWDAQRYISFIIPFVTIVTTVGLYTCAAFIYRIVNKPRWFAVGLVIGFVLLAGPWVSLTGVSGDGVLLRPALADRSATDLGYADVASAYAYVLEHYQAGEIVLMQTPRFYYWVDPSVPVEKLGGYQRLSLEDFKLLAAKGETGGWVVYNFTHQRHLRDGIKDYIGKRFDRITELSETRVHVYHFTPEDLLERRKTKK